jgi:alcohol dehydrogenase (cytochrome c)
VIDYTQGAVITSPPLVVKDKVITGFGGGEYGVRRSLQAYDINTGKQVWKTYTCKQVWKTYTTPLKDEPNGDTWKGDSAEHGGGAAWLVGSYDPWVLVS